MLSIIIPTKNEEKYLPQLLKTITEQEVDFDYEIIIADNFSEDKTRQIARSYGCIVCDGGLPSIGRNRGVKVSRGDWILFLDADVFLEPGNLQSWLNKIKLTRQHGIVTPYAKCRSDERTLGANIYFWSSYIGYNFLGCVFGSCIMVSRDIFMKTGGFDENIYLLEDVDFVKRAKKFTNRLNIKPYVHNSSRRMKSMGSYRFIFFTSWWYILSVFGIKQSHTGKNRDIYKL